MKGAEGTILVSDALSFAGLPLGEYEKDGLTYLLTENVVKYPAENVLAGAVQPVSKCVSNMMRFTLCDLKDAIGMASTNPAQLMGLDHLGEISPGETGRPDPVHHGGWCYGHSEDNGGRGGGLFKRLSICLNGEKEAYLKEYSSGSRPLGPDSF